MKKAQTVIEYALIMAITSVIVLGIVLKFDLNKLKKYSVYGTEGSEKGQLVLPPMTK